jgi:single-strand DNA-binding protein
VSFQINNCTVSGGLTRDPETRSLPSGTNVTNFSIAYTDRRKNQETGAYDVEVVSFFDCLLFGGQGDWLAKNASKGTPITVSGQLEQQRWEKDGQQRSKVCIVARDVFLGQRGGGSQQQAPAQQGGYDGMAY